MEEGAFVLPPGHLYETQATSARPRPPLRDLVLMLVARKIILAMSFVHAD